MRPAILVGMILMMTTLVAAQFSINIADYYVDSNGWYLTDGLNSDDTTLNGTTASNGMDISVGGWTLVNSDPTYTSSCAYYGSVGISVESTGAGTEDQLEYVLDTANSSFSGIVHFAFKYTGGNPTSEKFYVNIRDNPNTNSCMVGVHQSATFDCVDFSDCDNLSSTADGNWHNMSFDFTGSNIEIYIDGDHADTCPALNNLGEIEIYTLGNANGAGCIDYLWVSNTDQPFANTLLNLNCTSCGIAGDTQSPYLTSDSTPTFTFGTAETISCRIGNEDTSYETFGSSRDCDSGNEVQSHTCTLTAQDSLSELSEELFIFCNATGLQSGTLQMAYVNVHTAISNGVSTSYLGSSASIVTDQRVYVRTKEDNHALATFDSVIRHENRRWGIHYTYDWEAPLGTFYNLSPVFYYLDIVNSTLLNITDEVSAFINNTVT